MVIGGYDKRLNKPGSEMAYTPSTKTSGWFTVKVRQISARSFTQRSFAGCVLVANPNPNPGGRVLPH